MTRFDAQPDAILSHVVRSMELVGAALALIGLGPLLVALALAVRLTSPGPVLFRQTRVGKGGRTFRILKFRTMYHGSVGSKVTAAGDCRVTPIGRILRATKADELPQFFNVLRGDMGFVGPRPETPNYVHHYPQDQMEVLSVRPGITGPSQLLYRHEEEVLRQADDPELYYISHVLPRKLAVDLEYVRTRTVFKDCVYVLQTILVLLPKSVVACRCTATSRPFPELRPVRWFPKFVLLAAVWLNSLKLPWRTGKACVDILAATLAWCTAYLLSSPHTIRWLSHPLLAAFLSASIVVAVVFLLTGYRPSWRTTSTLDSVQHIQAVALGGLLIGILSSVLGLATFPAVLVGALLSVEFTLAPRFMVRHVGSANRARQRIRHKARRRAVIIGCGAEGASATRMILEDSSSHLELIGFIDDDPRRFGERILGIPVLGGILDLPRIVMNHRVDQVIIAVGNDDVDDVVGALPVGDLSGLEVALWPSTEDIICSSFRKRGMLDISMRDLLGRPVIEADPIAAARFIQGQRVLITGAGGSIGSELCRQVAALQPQSLIALDHSEQGLFWLERELIGEGDSDLHMVVTDIQDRDGLDVVFREHRPTVVIHAAAHKHVPLMEANPRAAVRNNIIGTRQLAELAISHMAHSFVLISTDKAVNPTSIMGTTKRIAEMVVQSLAQRIALASSGQAVDTRWGFTVVPPEEAVTRFSVVRFGNVLGSSGSVVQTMCDQIRAGGPVTITHEEMVRYFMTIEEAVGLVLQAGAMGRGGETFLLEMGEPVRILDLATRLIRLSGLVRGMDIPIRITGIRPGEKIREEVLTDEEGAQPTEHPRIYRATPGSIDHGALLLSIEALAEQTRCGLPAITLERLRDSAMPWSAGIPKVKPSPAHHEALSTLQSIR